MVKILIITFLTLGCGGTPQSNTKEPYQNKVNEDFNIFLAKFSKNKAFQTERIIFPLVFYTENEQGNSVVKKLTANSWRYTDFVGLNKRDKKNEIEIEISSKTEAKLIYSIEDSGVYVIHYFIKKDGKWYMYKISDESD